MQYFLQRAARELEVETKSLAAGTTAILSQQDWPGNVRQLENLCRWLTVMAPGQEILPEDLPEDLHAASAGGLPAAADWQVLLRQWAQQQLAGGTERLLDEALPVFEKVLIDVALQQTGGRRQDAARLLGWGRNTLTRKLKELDLK
jgi:two-component system nitrogen regulation response regulator GlnG